MKKLLIVLSLLIFVSTLSACKSDEYENISNEQLSEMLASDDNYYFIDVRTEQEFNNLRIPGFSNLDLYSFDKNPELINTLDLDKSIPVVIMCNSGNRSVTAAKIFIDQGFTTVYNLKNGIQGWDGTTN
ncbi:rhodanese-like domain-containing protein [Candidatus Izimaplasma bacterium ZiA1]|uniref:rhodanese-like domain-containing protein n=1 Tax=Candidatus Izimoplasma sp. ZiA1 TaxID=2024899 RepID=UPI00143A1954